MNTNCKDRHSLRKAFSRSQWCKQQIGMLFSLTNSTNPISHAIWVILWLQALFMLRSSCQEIVIEVESVRKIKVQINSMSLSFLHSPLSLCTLWSNVSLVQNCLSSTLTVWTDFQNPNILFSILNGKFTARLHTNWLNTMKISFYMELHVQSVMKRISNEISKKQGMSCLAMKKSTTAPINASINFLVTNPFNMFKSNLRRRVYAVPFREEGNPILITPRRLHVSLPGLVSVSMLSLLITTTCL